MVYPLDEILHLSLCAVSSGADSWVGALKKADYLFGLKGNQGRLRDHVELFFDAQRERNFADTTVTYHETVEKEHGRIEIRRSSACGTIEWLRRRQLQRGRAASSRTSPPHNNYGLPLQSPWYPLRRYMGGSKSTPSARRE